MTQSLYTFRPQSDGNTFTCAKLDVSLGVVETYTITRDVNTEKLTCTCPSRAQPCKHVLMLFEGRKSFPDTFQERYWTCKPYGKSIKSFTEDELAD